ncbi:hypothetical protein DFA_03184 [Cavenderia fasciculata]|uniref:Peptidase M28 domain-containing protein n=1 Tax=Cavenderia fasciculata TaxID=261658 RepID=F4PGV5_CACFS|nr:uncharacterized protein DFA_03184 [Cavenderia fasciculata]EGG24939.1 hypothetical protein DFA_03184 [Cavenderia fasciculata]|eukprot:XP_004362790.1 hypothetical protein DFA_03184 [Cavenderia fasciculata]
MIDPWRVVVRAIIIDYKERDNRMSNHRDEDDEEEEEVEEFDVDLGNNESFLDTLVNQETRRRPNQSPVFGYIYSPRCMRGAGLVIGIIALLFSAVLLSISFSDLNKTNDNSSDDTAIDFTNKLPLWVLNNIDITRIKSNVQYLSSDLLEGRAPGTRGEELATLFIQSQYQSSSIEPMGENGGYFQNVNLYSINNITTTSLNFSASDKSPVNLTYLTDFVTSTEMQESSISLSQISVVFVGHGVSSKEMQWDDYNSTTVSVKGKIAMILLGAPESFNSSATAYFGRKDYKLSAARDHGAVGVILVHTDATYGYPWPYVQSKASDTKYMLQEAPQQLQVVAMVNEAAANKIIDQSADPTHLKGWQVRAGDSALAKLFLPFDIGLLVSFDLDCVGSAVVGRNVIGGIVGDKNPDQVVIVMAHHDHLGMKQSTVPGGAPTIYHGAVDDASGVGILLELANILGLYNKVASTNTFSQVGLISPPDRTILFVSTTAEEGGLLGAKHFLSAFNKTKQIVAVINYDGANVLNETLDIVSVGMGLSPDLDLFISTAADDENKMIVTQDPLPQLHLLYRNDALVFLQNQIPSVMLSMGTRFKGMMNDTYYQAVITDYFTNVYHTPADIVKPEYTFLGAVQQSVIWDWGRFLYPSFSFENQIDNNNSTMNHSTDDNIPMEVIKDQQVERNKMEEGENKRNEDFQPVSLDSSQLDQSNTNNNVKYQKRQLLKKRIIGLSIVLLITTVNTTSSELSQYILVNDYYKPFLMIYYNMIWLILALPIELAVFYGKHIKNNSNEPLIQSLHREFLIDNKVTLKTVAWVTFLMSILYTGLNYIWILGLPLTEVSTSNALFQSATIYVFFLSIWILKEKPTILKSVSVIFFIAGVVGILLADRASSVGAYEFPDAVKGDIMMVAAAALYGVWQVLTAKFLVDKNRTMVHSYIGLMGFWCLLFGIPVLLALHYSGYETFEMPTTSRSAGLISVSAFLTFTANYLINWGLSLVSPLAVRGAELLIIPATLLFDIFVKKVVFPAISIPGFLFIIFGFLIMMFVENIQLKRRQRTKHQQQQSHQRMSSLDVDNTDNTNPPTLSLKIINFMRRNLV